MSNLPIFFFTFDTWLRCTFKMSFLFFPEFGINSLSRKKSWLLSSPGLTFRRYVEYHSRVKNVRFIHRSFKRLVDYGQVLFVFFYLTQFCVHPLEKRKNKADNRPVWWGWVVFTRQNFRLQFNFNWSHNNEITTFWHLILHFALTGLNPLVFLGNQQTTTTMESKGISAWLHICLIAILNCSKLRRWLQWNKWVYHWYWELSGYALGHVDHGKVTS